MCGCHGRRCTGAEPGPAGRTAGGHDVPRHPLPSRRGPDRTGPRPRPRRHLGDLPARPRRHPARPARGHRRLPARRRRRRSRSWWPSCPSSSPSSRSAGSCRSARHGCPSWGTALGVLGCFGHTVFGGISMVYLMMARDETAPRRVRRPDDPAAELPRDAVLGRWPARHGARAAAARHRAVPQRAPARCGWVRRSGRSWSWSSSGTAVSSYASYLSVLLLAAAFFALAGVIDPDGSRREIEPVPAEHV